VGRGFVLASGQCILSTLDRISETGFIVSHIHVSIVWTGRCIVSTMFSNEQTSHWFISKLSIVSSHRRLSVPPFYFGQIADIKSAVHLGFVYLRVFNKTRRKHMGEMFFFYEGVIEVYEFNCNPRTTRCLWRTVGRGP